MMEPRVSYRLDYELRVADISLCVEEVEQHGTTWSHDVKIKLDGPEGVVRRMRATILAALGITEAEKT